MNANPAGRATTGNQNSWSLAGVKKRIGKLAVIQAKSEPSQSITLVLKVISAPYITTTLYTDHTR